MQTYNVKFEWEPQHPLTPHMVPLALNDKEMGQTLNTEYRMRFSFFVCHLITLELSLERSPVQFSISRLMYTMLILLYIKLEFLYSS